MVYSALPEESQRLRRSCNDLTMRHPLVLLLAILAAGCSGESLDPAACEQLDQQIAGALAMPGGSCQTDADCDIIGGQLGFPTCDCAPYAVDCSGLPVASNAPGLARARTLIDQRKSGGCAARSACDCAPRGPVHCTPDHQCTAAERSCNLPPPDAGIDAAVAGP
jgi:hypothetical protein